MSNITPINYQNNSKSPINKTGASGINVTKGGYIYIYFSNQSATPVSFDNVMLTHTRSALLEETHYYPFGLTMAGISTKAANTLDNKRKWNKGSELESKEFSDGSGLELYATPLRSLDPQIGRWHQIDPKPTYEHSLYSSMGNNPITFNDPLGDTIKPNSLAEGELYLDRLNKGAKVNNKTSPLSFSENGALVVNNEKVKKLNKTQQAIFNKLNQVNNQTKNILVKVVPMGTVVSNFPLTPGQTLNLVDNDGKDIKSTTGDVKIENYGGGFVTPYDPATNQSVITLMNEESNAPNLNTAGVSNLKNPSFIIAWHETVGHPFYRDIMQDPKQRGRAVEFENVIRKLNNLPLRGFDEVHPNPNE
jgi:RHS repeat-associated protein